MAYSVVRIPVACTLSAESAADRIEDWRRFFASSVTAVERTSDRRLRVRLADSPMALTAAVDLAQREKACCAFFEFSVDVDATSRWLVVGVPAEAAGTLAEFATLTGFAA